MYVERFTLSFITVLQNMKRAKLMFVWNIFKELYNTFT